MEWSLPVNDMLSEKITKLNYTLIPPGFNGDVRDVRAMQESLTKVIDAIGEQSAAAQGLNRVITTTEKLRNSPSHTLYLLKDPEAKNRQGEVIGMLKVGRKHLFLFDEQGQVREVEPLCVLDFYVLSDRQRAGFGCLLFDYMLHDMEANCHDLAIDGPSPKMEQFLAKNYGVENMMRQNNNFAVSPMFFARCTADTRNKSGQSTPTASAAVGRFTAPRPHSGIANVIHGGASYYTENNGDGSGRESERSESEESPAPPSDDEPLPEPQVWTVHEEQNWDDDDYSADLVGAAAAASVATAERPATLPVEGDAQPPAAPAAFADVPAAGLPSGASTPAGGAARRDSQLTDKGYFDVKFYHNRLW